MPASTDWRDEKFNEVFDENMVGLERRRKISPGFTLSELEGIIKALYVQEGNDWVGRGELQDIVLHATIAAHEQFLEKWKMSIQEGS